MRLPRNISKEEYKQKKSRVRLLFILYIFNEFNTVEKTGGDLTHKHATGDHTLIIDEIPGHNHTFNDGLKLIVPKADDPYAVTDYILKTGQQLQVNNTGGSQAHNHGDTGSNSNLQPYITVYMWKRVS